MGHADVDELARGVRGDVAAAPQQRRDADEAENEGKGGGEPEDAAQRPLPYVLTDRTIPLMKNFRRPMNSAMVGMEVKMTAVMIQGMLPPP